MKKRGSKVRLGRRVCDTGKDDKKREDTEEESNGRKSGRERKYRRRVRMIEDGVRRKCNKECYKSMKKLSVSQFSA
jgi:hypothetical protein